MSLTRDQVIAWLERLTVAELDELILELQQRLHLQPVRPYHHVTMGASLDRTMGMPLEPDEFDVELVSVGADKLRVIKAVRELLPLGLMEAKKLVESAPVVLRECLRRPEAEEFAEPLRRAGATIRLR